MKRKITNYGKSVREKLLNLKKTSGHEYMYLLARYFNERLLYRVSVSQVHGRKVGSKMENITPSDWTFMKIGPEKTIYEWSIEMAA